MNEQRIEPLNQSEQAWVRDELANVRALIALHCPDIGESPLTLEVLDRTYKAAYESAPTNDAEYANSIINAIGIAFGQYLVDQLGLEWCAVFDEHGQELAVVGLPGKANMLVFPPNLIAKRWFAGTTDFLCYVYKGIEGDLASFREDWKGQDLVSAERSRHGITSWIRGLFSRSNL